MTTKTVKLLAGATDIKIKSASDKETVIEFTCPAWTSKTCTHTVIGRWEIESTNRNLVTLVNHDQIIK
jgi:hypothetical protein